MHPLCFSRSAPGRGRSGLIVESESRVIFCVELFRGQGSLFILSGVCSGSHLQRPSKLNN